MILATDSGGSGLFKVNIHERKFSPVPTKHKAMDRVGWCWARVKLAERKTNNRWEKYKFCIISEHIKLDFLHAPERVLL